jgi:hypothetical protein
MLPWRLGHAAALDETIFLATQGLSSPRCCGKNCGSYGHPRYCTSARCCDPAWSCTRAQPRSAWQADWRAHAWCSVSRLGAGRSVHPSGNRDRRQPRNPRHRHRRGFSRSGRDCPKRERSSRARPHHSGLRLGDSLHGSRVRDRAVADRDDGRCSRLRHSHTGRAFREIDRSALALATNAGRGSVSRRDALAYSGGD